MEIQGSFSHDPQSSNCLNWLVALSLPLSLRDTNTQLPSTLQVARMRMSLTLPTVPTDHAMAALHVSRIYKESMVRSVMSTFFKGTGTHLNTRLLFLAV